MFKDMNVNTEITKQDIELWCESLLLVNEVATVLTDEQRTTHVDDSAALAKVAVEVVRECMPDATDKEKEVVVNRLAHIVGTMTVFDLAAKIMKFKGE